MERVTLVCLDQCVFVVLCCMCAVWCSGINCTLTEGTDGGNIMETVTIGESGLSCA